jgi:hypothetical protein
MYNPKSFSIIVVVIINQISEMLQSGALQGYVPMPSTTKNKQKSSQLRETGIKQN